MKRACQIRTALVVLAAVLIGSMPVLDAASEEQIVKPESNANTELRQQVNKTTAGFQDISATAVVEYKNDEVLSKMGKKYAQQYELKKALLRFKAPDKTRLEGALGALKFQYITTNDFKIVKIKPIGYEKKESIQGKPHRRQGAVDLGLITKDLWNDYVVEKQTTEGEGDNAMYVLDLTRGDKFSNLHRVWINQKTLNLVKMEKYDPDKVTLRLVYKYSEPQVINGITIPTKIEMLSPQGELAGVTKIKEIKVNTGLDDSLFK